jgi:hypothetical protein
MQTDRPADARDIALAEDLVRDLLMAMADALYPGASQEATTAMAVTLAGRAMEQLRRRMGTPMGVA